MAELLTNRCIREKQGTPKLRQASRIVGLVIFGHVGRRHKDGCFSHQGEFCNGHCACTRCDDCGSLIGEVHSVDEACAHNPITGMGVEPSLTALGMAPTALPQDLIPSFRQARQFAQDGLHRFIHGLCPKATTHDKDHRSLVRESPMSERGMLMFRGGVRQIAHVGPQWIARQDDSIFRKPALEPRQSGTNAVDPLGQQSIGDARKTVLFLDECGETLHSTAWSSKGPLAKPPTPTTTWGQYFRNKRRAFHKLLKSLKGKVRLRALVKFSFDSTDPETVDVVSCGGDFVHFHPSQGAYKSNVCIRVATLDFVRDGKGGVDVTSDATSRNEDVVKAAHQVSVFPLWAPPAPANSCWTTRVTANIMPRDRQVNSKEVPP